MGQRPPRRAERGAPPISYAQTPRAIAEERRLFYVAVTRAGADLSLSWSLARHASKQKPPRLALPLRTRTGRGEHRRGSAAGDDGDDQPVPCLRAGPRLPGRSSSGQVRGPPRRGRSRTPRSVAPVAGPSRTRTGPPSLPRPHRHVALGDRRDAPGRPHSPGPHPRGWERRSSNSTGRVCRASSPGSGHCAASSGRPKRGTGARQ